MHSHPMVLLTIVCEERLLSMLIDVLRQGGATGYTTFPARGVTFGRGDTELPRQVVEVIVPHDEADRILDDIVRQDFHNESFILWTSEVKVLRRGRFVR